jgi:hypothetical protein
MAIENDKNIFLFLLSFLVTCNQPKKNYFNLIIWLYLINQKIFNINMIDFRKKINI